MAKLTREERTRNQRRRSRQMVGFFVSILVVIGCVAIIKSGAALVATIFDDTAEKEEYASKLSGLVLFDPLPFEGVANIQDTTLREAAVWGTLYSIMATETGLDAYDRDPTTDQVMLPSIEVDAYLATIFGPAFQLSHATFEMEGMTITFDETLQCYYIPITSVVGEYTPVVELFTKEDGRLYVTVGYIAIETSNTFMNSAAPNQITKYMDYVFERTDGNWYLVALQESAMKAPESAAITPATSTVPALEDFEAFVLEDLANSQSTTTDETDGEADAAEATDAAETAEDTEATDADEETDSE